MRDEWRAALIERLASSAGSDGGWGYGASRRSCAEPTSLACLALAVHTAAPSARRGGLRFLDGQQSSDGSVPAYGGIDAPRWTTATALLAAIRSAPSDVGGSLVSKCVTWLLTARGEGFLRTSDLYGHDTALVGWSWAAKTHSWVEPTAYSILALRAAGRGDHPRVREGVRLLLDRAIPGGGWNYGNNRVLGTTLRPSPDTTGVALAALCGEPATAAIEEGLSYLENELPRVRAPQSLSWGLMGLKAWDRKPADASKWLTESAERCLQGNANPFYNALLLLADSETPFVGERSAVTETSHG